MSTDVVITPQNQYNYLTKPGTSGNATFSGATAAVLSVGTSLGEGSLTIDGGKLVSPNCVFIAGKGNNTPNGPNAFNNGTVTVTNGGSLTVAGCVWNDPYHNPTAAGAQLSLAYSGGAVTGTLNITKGGQVHANALTAVGGGSGTGVVNISGEGSVMDFDLRGETQASQVQFFVGYEGNGQGTVNVKDGALLTTATSRVSAITFIGVFGNATGTINVDNATANLGVGALLGHQAGAKGYINVTNGGSLLAYELDVGSDGTGAVTVDATSKVDLGGLFISNGSVDNAGILEAAVVQVSGSNKFTNSGTATIYNSLTLLDSAQLDGSGVVNMVDGAVLTNNGNALAIDKLTLDGAASAKLTSDGSGKININQILTNFSGESHTSATSASVQADDGAATDLSGTQWFFSLTEDIATSIYENNGTRYLTNMKEGVSAHDFCYKLGNKTVWFEAVSGEDGTYVGTKSVELDLGDASSATLANTKGDVQEGETISEEQNLAQIVGGETKANLYVMVETRAESEDVTGTNGQVVVSVIGSDNVPVNYSVNNAYIGNSLTLKNTDLVAEGDINMQSTVTVENSKIESLGGTVVAQGAAINLKHSSINSDSAVGTVLDSVIKGTGSLTKLAITNSELIAGNSPGLLELNLSILNNGTLRFYVGDEAMAALAAGNDSLTLDVVNLVTSGFVLNDGTVFSGEVVLELWSDESQYAYNTGRIFDTVGQSLQLFKAGDGVDLSTVLGNVSFTLGSTFDAATAWKWDTSTLAKDGFVRVVVPEPATATLSLLALAGLAARRRRKA